MNRKHPAVYIWSLGADEGSSGLMLGWVGESLNFDQTQKGVRGRSRGCQSLEMKSWCGWTWGFCDLRRRGYYASRMRRLTSKVDVGLSIWASYIQSFCFPLKRYRGPPYPHQIFPHSERLSFFWKGMGPRRQWSPDARRKGLLCRWRNNVKNHSKGWRKVT